MPVQDEELRVKEKIVTSFCAKCGTPFAVGELWCSFCGTPTVPGAATAAFAPPAGAPAKPGSGTLKIVLIIVAVAGGLGVLGLGAIGYLGHRVAKSSHVDSSGRMTMKTPAGSITATPDENLSASDLGVDIYPGAESTRGSMRMEMPNGSAVVGVFLTSDSPDQVVAFYKNQLGSDASVHSFLGNTILQLLVGQHEIVQVTVAAKSSVYKGKTRISIMHMNVTENN